MTYTPTPEKLQDLGFEHMYTRSHVDFYRDGVDRDISVLVSGDILLEDDNGTFARFTLPSEEFFVQLLTAIGWTPCPTATAAP